MTERVLPTMSAMTIMTPIGGVFIATSLLRSAAHENGQVADLIACKVEGPITRSRARPEPEHCGYSPGRLGPRVARNRRQFLA